MLSINVNGERTYKLADLGVDDSKLRSIAAESERLKNLSRQYIKTLR